MTRPRIVVVGSLVFDFVARAERIPREGETILGDLFGMFPGGKGANQAAQAGRLGAQVHMVGRVGADFPGERLLASLRESHVSTEHVRKDPAVSTGCCCIHVDSAGKNSIIMVPQANAACSPADVDAAADVLRSADVLLCQLEIPLATVRHAVELAVSANIPVILNPAPAQRLNPSLLKHLTFLTPNEHEAQVVAGTYSAAGDGWESSIAKQLLLMGPRNVIITLGSKGAYLATSETKSLIPTFEVTSLDTTAAGDAFNGALAVGLAEGMPAAEAVRFANAAGALSTTRPGAQPSLAWRPEVDGLLNSLPSAPGRRAGGEG
jgi:ribokinase